MINTPLPGMTGDTISGDTSTNTGLVDMKFIALAIEFTFLFTAIVVTLLVLVLVRLYLTCKEKKEDKYQLNSNQACGSKEPIELKNP